MQTEFSLTYYLEDLNRLKELSIQDLDELAARYPAVANIHFLRAKKYQLEGKTDEISVFKNVSFRIFDHALLYSRMTASELELNAIANTQIPAEIPESTNENVSLFESELERSIAALKTLESQNQKNEQADIVPDEIEKSKEAEKKELEENNDNVFTEEEGASNLNFVSIEMITRESGHIEDMHSMNEEEIMELSPFAQWLLHLKSDAPIANNDLSETDHESDDPIMLSGKDQTGVVDKADDLKKNKEKKEIHKTKQKESEEKKKKDKDKRKENEKKKKKDKDKDKDKGKDKKDKKKDKYKGKDKKDKKKKHKNKKQKKSSLKERAKRSLELSQELVTEPLAELLASQGHIDESIVMFTKLSLIFPEKSAYFADRIKRLKNNQHDH